MNIRPRPLLVATLSLALMAGCATVGGNYTISSEVHSFGEWPAGRAMGTYAFERLPSQEASAAQQAALEQAARGAIERAGFKASTSPSSADVLVQLGARTTRVERDPYGDRYWPRVSAWGGRGVYWGLNAPLYHSPRIDREVAVLLRDRASGKTVYETRAGTSGYNSVDSAFVAAMFDAAMKDFPRPAISPRRVDTQVLAQPAPMPTAGQPPAQPVPSGQAPVVR